MGIQSYNKIYLPYVAENLGVMFEYAVSVGYEPEKFWNTFIVSDVAKQIERGNPKYLTCSAFDYLMEIYHSRVNPKIRIYKDRYFWAGWILAQFQFFTGYSFYRINSHLPIKRVLELYPTLHEADVTKFFDVAKTYFHKLSGDTNLKKIRIARGISQRELAERADVDIHSIQLYEQGRLNINKAQSETLYKISIVLGCNIEDLLELDYKWLNKI